MRLLKLIVLLIVAVIIMGCGQKVEKCAALEELFGKYLSQFSSMKEFRDSLPAKQVGQQRPAAELAYVEQFPESVGMISDLPYVRLYKEIDNEDNIWVEFVCGFSGETEEWSGPFALSETGVLISLD